jgi:integrase
MFGTRKHQETGRNVYVGDIPYKVVRDQADLPFAKPWTWRASWGQRPADVLKLDERDVRDGVLSIKQNKTSTRLRIQIVGDLAALLDRLTARKSGHNPRSTGLIVDERGQPLGRDALRFRYDRARESAGISKEEFQFRDLRAKAGTDEEAATDLSVAQALLSHGSHDRALREKAWGESRANSLSSERHLGKNGRGWSQDASRPQSLRS